MTSASFQVAWHRGEAWIEQDWKEAWFAEGESEWSGLFLAKLVGLFELVAKLRGAEVFAQQRKALLEGQ